MELHDKNRAAPETSGGSEFTLLAVKVLLTQSGAAEQLMNLSQCRVPNFLASLGEEEEEEEERIVY